VHSGKARFLFATCNAIGDLLLPRAAGRFACGPSSPLFVTKRSRSSESRSRYCPVFLEQGMNGSRLRIVVPSISSALPSSAAGRMAKPLLRSKRHDLDLVIDAGFDLRWSLTT